MVLYMIVINYFESDKKEHWLNEINKSDWGGAKFLYELLSDNTFLMLLEIVLSFYYLLMMKN